MKLLRRLSEVLKQRVQNQQGVTLIELLAVIVILGIIAAIGIPALMDSREQAQRETYNTNAKIMTEAAKRKLLMGQTYSNQVNESENDKTFNLEELLVEANIAHGDIVEGTASEGDETSVSNATAPVDETDDSKGTYELNVADGTVVYNPDGGAVEETTTETTDENSTDDGTGTTQPEDQTQTPSTLDVEREPVPTP